MKKQNAFIEYNLFANNSGDGAGGGSGSSGDGASSANANIESLVKEAVERETEGLKVKNAELIGKLKNAQEKLTEFDGIDVEKVRSMLKNVENSEEAKLISEGKIDDVLRIRTDKIQSKYSEEIETLSSKNEELAKANSFLNSEIQDMIVGEALRRDALKANVLPEAIEDILLRGKSLFSVDDNRDVVARDSEGNLMKTQDGKTLLTPERFIDSLKDTNPYYWPASTGTGANGANKFKSRTDQMDKLNNIARSDDFDLEAYRKNRGAARDL